MNAMNKSERSTGTNRPEKYGNRPLIFMFIFILNKRKQNDPISVLRVGIVIDRVRFRVRYTTATATAQYIILLLWNNVYYDSHINTLAAATACERAKESVDDRQHGQHHTNRAVSTLTTHMQ